MIDFTTIDYLKSGNARQKKAYQTLLDLEIFDKLSLYQPLLAGTIPIQIDLVSSDLDIICFCKNHISFTKVLQSLYGDYLDFEVYTHDNYDLRSTVAKFKFRDFEIEIFGQNRPTQEQNAYRHMLIEHLILEMNDADFRNRIIALKESGIKTEPASAQLLGLQGDPYEAVLNYKPEKKIN